MRTVFFLVSVLICNGPVFSAEDLKEMALAYMSTMEEANWEKQRTWYTEESIFEDPTSDLWGEPWHFKGPEAIVNFWRTSYEGSGTLEVKYQYKKVFVVGSRVILEFDSLVKNDGSFLQSKIPFSATVHVVTILRFENGKVIHHLDHADYPGFYRELDAEKARRKAKE